MASESPPNELVGRSAAMRSIRFLLERARAVDAPVLLQGETGTGKSLMARSIHEGSRRRDGPFVPVNCAGIPAALFESEFFGHRKGAFTGALESRPGLFQAASGGTLFLDEVAELTLPQQAKLLTALDDGAIRRVGEREWERVRLRVVAATAADLQERMASGRFRRDLYHRLALLRIRLPPLREREGDLELLAVRFLRRAARRHGGPCVPPGGAVLERLRRHPWPGNVRELAHVLEAAVILAGPERVGVEHLELAWRGASGRSGEGSGSSDGCEAGGDAPDAPDPADEGIPGGTWAEDVSSSSAPGGSRPAGPDGVRMSGTGVRPPASGGLTSRTRYSFHGSEEEERRMVLRTLARCRGNRSRTARELGMSRSTLRSKLRRWGV